MTTEAYFSFDIEADGPIPGPFSMSSIGACVAGHRDTAGQIHRSDTDRSYYAELKPISEDFVPDAAAVSGLDRAVLVRDGKDPAHEMAVMNGWIESSCRELAAELGVSTVRPIFAAYPLGYDWMWISWYSNRFAGGSPFGHSTAIDMKTLFATKAGRGIVGATKRNMPKHLLGTGPHTHNALDDAREQGQMLMNMLEWEGSA